MADHSNTVPRIASRRKFLLRCLGWSGSGLLLYASPASRIYAASAAENQQRWIQEANRMRQQAISAGDQPYGAVVVKQGRIVGFGPSQVITGQDPTAHAEMVAIRAAAKQLGTRDLSGCELYSTSPPCRMCETAAYWANIRRMYHGNAVSDGGAPGYGC